jgi:uncharacterized protein with NRDE domain
MCTVTVVPRETGIRVMSNRDERRTRPAAIPPRVHELGGRLAAFPVDPQGGGSWIGVNDADIAVALLNVHSAPRHCTEGPQRSRGLIVRELLGCGSMAHVVEAIASLEVEAFETFRLVIVHRSTVAVATHDGARTMTCRQISLDTPLLFTSSSLGDARVEAPRQRLFERMVVQGRAGWLDGQAQFHRHQWRSRPEISVRMEREDALTVSRTVVDVTRAGRGVLYEAPVRERASREGQTWCSLH